MVGWFLLGALTLLLLPFLMPVLRFLWWTQSLIPDHLLWNWVDRHPEATIHFLMWAVPICLIVSFVGISVLVASADPSPLPDHRRRSWDD